MKQKNSLILGAGGSLGSMLRRNLRVKKQDSIFFQSRFYSKGVSFVWDLGSSQFSELKSFITKNNIKKIVMLYGGRAGAVVNDDVELQLIESCFETFYHAEVEKVLVASSAAIYAPNIFEVYSETDKVSLDSLYQKKKVNLELLGKRYSYNFKDLCLLRFGNVLGADSLTKLYVQAENHDFIVNRYSNGFLKRSYLSPSSLAYVMGELLDTKNSLPDILNVTTYKELYMDEIMYGLGISFEEKHINEKGRNVLLDTTLLESIISLPQKYKNSSFAIEDLMLYKSWVRGQGSD